MNCKNGCEKVPWKWRVSQRVESLENQRKKWANFETYFRNRIKRFTKSVNMIKTWALLLKLFLIIIFYLTFFRNCNYIRFKQSGSTSKITKSEKSRKSIKALNDYRKFLSLPEESPVIDEPVENEPKPAVSDLKLNDFKEILGMHFYIILSFYNEYT